MHCKLQVLNITHLKLHVKLQLQYIDKIKNKQVLKSLTSNILFVLKIFAFFLKYFAAILCFRYFASSLKMFLSEKF